MILTTWTGRELRTTVEVDWSRGRVFYTVGRVGTFTFERDLFGNTDGRAATLHVFYGRHEGEGYPYDQLPEPPVVFGVTLKGACGFNPEKLVQEPEHGHYMWRVDRAEGCEAPAGTRKRVHEICSALVTHYLTRDEYEAVEQARARYLAPARLRKHPDRINDLRGQIAALQADLAVELAGADVEAAMTMNGVARSA